MEYRLTEHAKDAVAKRKIKLEWVKQVLNSPQWTENDTMDDRLEHRLSRISSFGNRVLRVIVNTHSIPAWIVTAYFDRRRKD
jgi:hypothetical protein